MAKSVSNDACNNSGKPLASIASELDDNEAFLEETVMCEDGVVSYNKMTKTFYIQVDYLVPLKSPFLLSS
jgi:hypothetical protein